MNRSTRRPELADIRELARYAALRGPTVLAGRAPAEAALVVVHPESPVWRGARGETHIEYYVEPLAEVEQLAALSGVTLKRRQGHYVALLLGAAHISAINLEPASFALVGVS